MPRTPLRERVAHSTDDREGRLLGSAGTTANFGNATTGFYSPVSTRTGALNASVKCTPDTDPNDGADHDDGSVRQRRRHRRDDNNLPAYALLAMQQNSPTEGVRFEQSNKTICIENGSVASERDVDPQQQHARRSALRRRVRQRLLEQVRAPVSPSRPTASVAPADVNRRERPNRGRRRAPRERRRSACRPRRRHRLRLLAPTSPRSAKSRAARRMPPSSPASTRTSRSASTRPRPEHPSPGCSPGSNLDYGERRGPGRRPCSGHTHHPAPAPNNPDGSITTRQSPASIRPPLTPSPAWPTSLRSRPAPLSTRTPAPTPARRSSTGR